MASGPLRRNYSITGSSPSIVTSLTAMATPRGYQYSDEATASRTDLPSTNNDMLEPGSITPSLARAIGQRNAECGAAKSCHRGIGAEASALAGRGRQLSRTAGGAPSRATSARTARTSTTCRAGGTTTRLESIDRRGSGGSAPRARHGRPAGGARGSSPRAGGAGRRPRVWCAQQCGGG